MGTSPSSCSRPVNNDGWIGGSSSPSVYRVWVCRQNPPVSGNHIFAGGCRSFQTRTSIAATILLVLDATADLHLRGGGLSPKEQIDPFVKVWIVSISSVFIENNVCSLVPAYGLFYTSFAELDSSLHSISWQAHSSLVGYPIFHGPPGACQSRQLRPFSPQRRLDISFQQCFCFSQLIIHRRVSQ
ncbi:hypothetical protein BDV33DRAFT_62233 [Aspergillus novoparasiticus]|uniref:Uncharacterized protein n=1 Tax=Aspergillus novoparasiticus TaxID=986946 RepID=A0A5N6E7B4_9EURO|nr:hypothetical protein BDV33DRAFT_62233 [Aspergillus novoparasiticus]